ncbi:CAP domain-containing protein [Mycobacterium conspicuum]|nr:CAP domain-containing protein [Mycobacterium conspicuum]
MRAGARLVAVALILSGAGTLGAPTAHADNNSLNRAVISDVYTIQHNAGCTNDVNRNNALTLAAEWHADDMLGNRNINGDTGSDGSSPQDRADRAGFRGKVAQTVAINPALSITNLELIRQWYYDPGAMAIMSDCANTVMGVWSENALDRTVVVAMYGQPAPPIR